MQESDPFFSVPPVWLSWAMLKVSVLGGLCCIVTNPALCVSALSSMASAAGQVACSPGWGADCEILIHTPTDGFLEILLSMGKKASSSPGKGKKNIPNLEETAGNSTHRWGVLCSLDTAPTGCYHQEGVGQP